MGELVIVLGGEGKSGAVTQAAEWRIVGTVLGQNHEFST